jgi:hypothetical protein
MGVPGGPPQFVGQKAVGQYSLHSRAILAYYKNKWDKFCQFCGKFCQFCGQFCDVWKICLMFGKMLVCPKKFWTPKMVH